MIKKFIKYKGRILFEKVVVSAVPRMPKYYEEDEACFMFIEGASFTMRASSDVLKVNNSSALLSKCMNYFLEISQAEYVPNTTIEAIGVLLYPDMIAEIFDLNLLSRAKKKPYNARSISIDPLLQAFKDSLSYLIENPELADEEMTAFLAARDFPGRLECATLAWGEMSTRLPEF